MKGTEPNSEISVAGNRNSMYFPAPMLANTSDSLENGSLVASGSVTISPAKSPVSSRMFNFTTTGVGIGVGVGVGAGTASFGVGIATGLGSYFRTVCGGVSILCKRLRNSVRALDAGMICPVLVVRSGLSSFMNHSNTIRAPSSCIAPVLMCNREMISLWVQPSRFLYLVSRTASSGPVRLV